MSLDDEEEDAEDVADLLEQAKKEGKSESFTKANALLEQAKMYGVSQDDTQEASKYVAGKKKAKDDRLERERKEKERLTRVKREREERARQDRERQAYASNGFRGISKDDCYKIRQYAPQRICLKGTGGDACYGLKNYGLQQVCLKGAGGDACYGLKDYASQKICQQGVRTDACYGVGSNYNKMKSCQNFKGSTEFWLIFSYYGYYTRA